MPGLEKESNEFKKAIIQDVDNNNHSIRDKKKGKEQDKEEQLTWPKPINVTENAYSNFLETVVNSKNQFYPQRDQQTNLPNPNSGATFTVRNITRLRTVEGAEFLLSKGDIHAFDSLGDPVSFYVSYPEKWNRTKFAYKTEWNDKTKQLEKKLQGPSGTETVTDLEFNKNNLAELWNQRESDNIQLIVKNELDGKQWRSKM